MRSALCATASFGAALLWVLGHRGFGAVDLLGFALGSLPFGLWMAGVSHLFREVVHRPHGWGRLGAVAALALIGALVWTIAVTLLLGSWMAGFDLPVAWLWAIGGLVALVP